MCVPGLSHFTSEGRIRIKIEKVLKRVEEAYSTASGLGDCMGDRRQVEATVMKSVTICIRQPMQQLHRIPD